MHIYISGARLVSKLKTKEAYLKIDFAGCNFKCDFCNKYEICELSKDFLMDTKDAKDILKKNAGYASYAVFGGGEPCLQGHALMNVAEYARLLGYKVTLKTNGSRPFILKSLIERRLVDRVLFELNAPLYPGVFENISKAGTFFKSSSEVMKDIRKSIDILKKNDENVGLVFRTVIVPGKVYRKEDILMIGEMIRGVDALWMLKRFSEIGVSDNMKSIKRPSVEFLEKLRKICQRKFPELRIGVE